MTARARRAAIRLRNRAPALLLLPLLAVGVYVAMFMAGTP